MYILFYIILCMCLCLYLMYLFLQIIFLYFSFLMYVYNVCISIYVNLRILANEVRKTDRLGCSCVDMKISIGSSMDGR